MMGWLRRCSREIMIAIDIVPSVAAPKRSIGCFIAGRFVLYDLSSAYMRRTS